MLAPFWAILPVMVVCVENFEDVVAKLQLPAMFTAAVGVELVLEGDEEGLAA